ncbi:methyltransferase [Ascosphaera apis ARSEF 7405]|uniref:Methyltransferase n=1 Tax=Ascosphaera apis ARSEF 7405 TaxID=392613 RepID=A0A168DH57_9EURO|nr:methyltransferase [Ascosphaera apis ARSEF 7405]
MLPTPSTDHVSFRTIYEPAEDSYLFLDTLSSESECLWLHKHFDIDSADLNANVPPPLVVEVGTGSGVVLAFAAANAQHIFGRNDLLALGVDLNMDACQATHKTVNIAIDEKIRESNTTQRSENQQRPHLLTTINGDLCSALRSKSIDVLLFNPPYVPTPELPAPSADLESMSKFDRESYLLALSYAGGDKGMEITENLLAQIPNILSERGVAYILFCKQNEPQMVQQRIREWEGGEKWHAEIVGNSGEKAGWERLVIMRIWRRHED